MPSTSLTPLKEPLAILPQYIPNSHTTIHVRGHQSGLSSYAFEITTATPTQQQQALFRSDGRFTKHHVVRNAATNAPLFEIHRKALSMLGTYAVQLDNGSGGGEAVRAERRWSLGRQRVDVHIPGRGVTLTLKGQDFARTKVNVYLGDSDACVMSCRRERWTRGQAWEADVAEGFDLSLVSSCLLVKGLALCSS